MAKPIDPITQLNAELLFERASALTRVGNKLQSHIDRAAELAARLATLSHGPVRDDLLREYEQARKDAETYHWYLVVQREALGLYNHAVLDEVYPLPKRIRH